MKRMKWLYPGMRVKRWVGLLILGVFTIATGLIVLLNAPVLSLYEESILTWVERWESYSMVVGAGLLAVGGFASALSIRNVIRSVVGAIRPADVPNLVEHVYKYRNLKRACTL